MTNTMTPFVMGLNGPVDVRDLNRESARIMAWNAKWDEYDALVALAHNTIMPKWAQVALTAENEDSERALDLYNDMSDALDRLCNTLEIAEEAGKFPPRDKITEARRYIERVWA